MFLIFSGTFSEVELLGHFLPISVMFSGESGTEKVSVNK